MNYLLLIPYVSKNNRCCCDCHNVDLGPVGNFICEIIAIASVILTILLLIFFIKEIIKMIKEDKKKG